MAQFLTGRCADGGVLWACVDQLALGNSPRVESGRFASYLAPFADEREARQTLIEAGADPVTIAAEHRPRKRRGR